MGGGGALFGGGGLNGQKGEGISALGDQKSSEKEEFVERGGGGSRDSRGEGEG